MSTTPTRSLTSMPTGVPASTPTSVPASTPTGAPTGVPTSGDLAALQALNRDYIASVQGGDVARFAEILAEDFYCSNPDGSLVDREGFLEQTARPVTISNLRADEVLIRLFGDIAIIHGRTSYKMPDGRQVHGRYTDVWAREGGTWKAVSAHVTRG